MSTRLTELLATSVEAGGGAPAVAGPGETLTYEELDRASNRLARALVEVGCEPGDRVCFILPKGPGAVAAMLGILKARCIYVPLDPDSPPARTAHMVRSAEPGAILATPEALALIRGLRDEGVLTDSVRLGWLGDAAPPDPPGDFDARDLETTSAEAVSLEGGSADDPAYILFTSGSTGTPKGVAITHANVASFLDWAIPHFGLGPDDRTSGHAPLHFDLSTFDIWGTLAAGGTLHPVPPHVNLHPHALARWIRERELTQWFSVPSVLGYLASFDAVEQGDFPSLRRVIWCGEVLPTPTLIHWMERLPHASFTNLYGPTEATVASSYHTVDEIPGDSRAEVPIGRACGGEELLVLDGGLGPVPTGEIGDLYIGGSGLSPGYWRNEEKTREAFLEGRLEPGRRIYRTGDLARREADGLLYFHGRKDRQIKSRGHRIELGEIEAAVNALAGVRECAVVGLETEGFEGTAIACAYVSESGHENDPADLREALGDLLPGYMLPARWKPMEELPKNPSGKIDRRRLGEMLVDEEENEDEAETHPIRRGEDRGRMAHA